MDDNKCTKETEIYSRVTGYFRRIKNWNEGKQEEFSQRKSFEVGKTLGYRVIFENGSPKVIKLPQLEK